MSALDFGLGSGHVTRQLLDLGLIVTAVDIDPQAGLDFATSLGEECKARFCFNQLDGEKFPYPLSADSFDLIVCREVLEHIGQYEKVLSELHRLLVDDGLLALSVPTNVTEYVFSFFDPDWYSKCEHLNCFKTGALKSMLWRYGFDVELQQGTGFRWALMWMILAPFRVQHRMGNPIHMTAVFRFAFWLSRLVSCEYGASLGNQIFPKSTKLLCRKSRPRVLLIFDYPDWILASWAIEINAVVKERFDVTLLSMDQLSTKFLKKYKGFFSICHALLPQVFGRLHELEPNVLIGTVHHWISENQYEELLRQADHLVTGSTQWKEKIISRGLPPEKVSVFLSGAPAEFFESVTLRNNDAPTMRIGFFAKPDSNEYNRKGIDRLLDLIQAIGQSGLTHHYHFVFSGDEWSEIRRACETNGVKATFAGRVPRDQMQSLYDCIDVYLILSRVEGGPATISEAMARGCVVVSTRVGLAIEVIEDGKNGMLLNDGIKSQEILQILDELRLDFAMRKTLSLNAEKFACEKLRFSKTFEGIDLLYDALIENSRTSKFEFSIGPRNVV